MGEEEKEEGGGRRRGGMALCTVKDDFPIQTCGSSGKGTLCMGMGVGMRKGAKVVICEWRRVARWELRGTC